MKWEKWIDWAAEVDCEFCVQFQSMGTLADFNHVKLDAL